jgi:ubiquinone biosynthesis protein COQ4
LGISAYAAFTALANPARQGIIVLNKDMVAALGETTGLRTLTTIRNKMLQNTTGRRILRERPVIHSSTVDFPKLLLLPENTFGHQYCRFMQEHNISADTRLDVKYIADQELAYVMLRYRQVHDFWHLLIGMPISLQAEIGLKLFEFLQTGLPMTALSAIFGPLRLNEKEQTELFNVYIPWAIHCANSSCYLMNVMYEDHFERDFGEFKQELGIPTHTFHINL